MVSLLFLVVNIHVIRKEWNSKTVKYEAAPAEKETKEWRSKWMVIPKDRAKNIQEQREAEPALRYEPASQKDRQQHKYVENFTVLENLVLD